MTLKFWSNQACWDSDLSLVTSQSKCHWTPSLSQQMKEEENGSAGLKWEWEGKAR